MIVAMEVTAVKYGSSLPTVWRMCIDLLVIPWQSKLMALRLFGVIVAIEVTEVQ